jgi:hypothetical protein
MQLIEDQLEGHNLLVYYEAHCAATTVATR